MASSSGTTPIYFWNSDDTWQAFLSQWYPCTFTDSDQVTYRSTEMYMMYKKATFFSDDETAQKILGAKTPRKQKALGRQVKNFDSERWDGVREQVVEDGNYLKFTQAGDVTEKHTLKELLLSTGSQKLVEASPHDRLWGIGFSADVAPNTPRDQWGQNLLGKMLMRVRKRLQGESGRPSV